MNKLNFLDNLPQITIILAKQETHLYALLLSYTNYHFDKLWCIPGCDIMLKIALWPILTHIIDNTIDLTCKCDTIGRKPIHLFAMYAGQDIFEYISKKTDINVQDKENWRPLHYACRMGMDITFLIKEKIDLECETIKKWRPIHFVLKYNHSAVKILLQNNIILECATINGWKPIHFALKYGSKEIISLLLQYGIIIDHTYLTYRGHDLLYFILTYSANINDLLYKINLLFPGEINPFTPERLRFLYIYNSMLYKNIIQL